MKRILAYSFAFATISASSFIQAAPSQAHPYPILTYSNTTQLQNFALTSCIAQAFSFEDKEIRDDVQIAASAYIEFSRVDSLEDGYISLAAFVKEWLKNSGVKHSDSQSKIAQCTQLYHSTELREAIDRRTAQFNAAAITQLRKEALAHCLALAYDNQRIRDDAEKARSEHRQTFGEIDQNDAYLYEAYQALFEPAKDWLAKHYESWLAIHYEGKHDSKLKLMKCIDFYNSPALYRSAEEYAHIRYWNAREATQEQNE